ncbi:thiamine phosphate synthase [Megasphaera vaginalis (ex Bordigoni et al. 2020)]|uniref:thiamine phosphate synthase n=1 Tax=Megasphaera vaginalis (ex Bordigoni et al. 2020) TaxID=2045301 RepID=UPI000C7BCDB5|nr:thiamine phosphate synthase [Megasphaera vaginalis (ex Bordigoni et al. 2020)]
MGKIIAITNRLLSRRDFWDQIELIAASPVDAIVLREKTLSEEDYFDYAKKTLQICNVHQTQCILHTFGKAAVRLHVPRFQCSLEYLETHSSIRYYMSTLGVSVHTAAEARKAELLGATYIVASHVFPTSCKPDDPPIGVSTLRDICGAVSLPVYALGGITPQTVHELEDVPTAGIVVMSGLMQCDDANAYVAELKK